MTKTTIKINGREVLESDLESIILDAHLKAKMAKIKAAVGDLPVELIFHGDLHSLKLEVKNCPENLRPELMRRLEPFV